MTTMQSSAAAYDAAADSSDPAQPILAALQATTVTNGWDAVLAISVAKANLLFEYLFAKNVAAGGLPAPITGTYEDLDTATILDVIGLQLGAPLISIQAGLDSGTASFTVPVLSGTLITTTVTAELEVDYVTSCEIITAASGYVLTGTVQLSAVAGLVQNTTDVVLDVTTMAGGTVNFNASSALQTSVGTAFIAAIQADPSGFRYNLGSLNTTGNSLTPTSFKIATQVDPTVEGDLGRVLLFIATTYNPGGGTAETLPIANVVPTGYDVALIISSQVLFQNVLMNDLTTLLANCGVTAQATANDSGVYSLTTTAGTYVAQNIDGTNDGLGWSVEAPNSPGAKEVSVPLSGLVLEAVQGSPWGLWVSWQQSWTLGWGWVTEYIGNNGTATITASMSGALPISTAAGDVFEFSQSSLEVTASASNVDTSWLNDIFNDGAASGGVCKQIAASIGANIASAIGSLTLPQITTMAVSNLLFPTLSPVQLSEVYIPGDLIAFGTIQQAMAVTPPFVEMGPGATQSFSATQNGASANCNWIARNPGIPSSSVGTVSPKSSTPTTTYTAASAAALGSAAVAVGIQATLGSDISQINSGVAIVLPAGVPVFPFYSLCLPGDTVQLSASVAGNPNATVDTWTASTGTISSSGLYTAPANVQSATMVTITASSSAQPSVSGTAYILLIGSGMAYTSVGVTPWFKQLTAGQSVDWSGMVAYSGDTNVTASLVAPAGAKAGKISGQTYIAPASISGLLPVALIVSSVNDPEACGIGLIVLTPGS